MMNVYHNCIATGGTDARVLKQHVDDKKDPLYFTYGGYHTGIDLEATSAFSVCPGNVLYVGQEGKKFSVIIQLTGDVAVMYKELNTVVVQAGQQLEVGDLVGGAKTFFHIDLLTRDESMWSVRARGITYYKHDPSTLLSQGYQYYKPDTTHYLYNPITPEFIAAHTGNMGEDA